VNASAPLGATYVAPDPRQAGSGPTAARARTLRRAGAWWWLAALALLVISGAIFPSAALIDGETMRAAEGATLMRPLAYRLTSPLSETLDALTMLSVPQHVALLVSITLLLVAARVASWRRRERLTSGAALAAVLHEHRLAARAIGVAVAVYGIGAVMPRPMAAIRVADPELVVVDFHSHTSASWDARPGFDAEANRAWHRAAGFDVAYITDHGTLDGARDAATRNPARVGGGTTLLPALESRLEGEHVNVLGTTLDRNELSPVGRPLSPFALAQQRDSGAMLIYTIPGEMRHVPASVRHGPIPLRAIELADGCPRGIAQGWRDRLAILRFADSLGLAVVSGSDSHGWGRTAPAWSVLRIPGWRSATPDSLDALIRQTIALERRQAVRVIERRSPAPDRSIASLALTLPRTVWSITSTLDGGERLAWLGWIAVAALAKRRKRRG
jgi:predicted metal-dependent phosphoesterase TrpH